MKNIVSICIVMLLSVGSAGAETYRCKDAAGNTVFTDAPASYAGCEQVLVQAPPTLPVVLPDNQAPPNSPPAMEQPATVATPVPEPVLVKEDFTFYLGQATALVAEFKDTQKLAINANLHRDKIEARRNLGDIRQRKNQLLEKLKYAGLSVAEDEEIKNILTAITAEE